MADSMVVRRCYENLEIMPIISIIMPAYNAEEYIEKSIESIISQTSENWELIIINDGSTDNTGQIISDWAKKEPRINVFSQQNKGVSCARNLGIEHAAGKYLAFLDSDDLYDKTFVEKMCAKIEQENVAVVYCGYFFEKFNKYIGEPYPEGSLLECNLLKKRGRIIMCNFVVEKDFLIRHNIKFTPGCSSYEDTEFITLCGLYGAKVNAVAESLFFYVYNGESVTNSLSVNHLLDPVSTMGRLIETARKIYCAPDKEAVLSRLESERRNTRRKLNRRLWHELKNKNFTFIKQVLESHTLKTHTASKNIIWSIRVGVLNSKNTVLWQIFSLLPFKYTEK